MKNQRNRRKFLAESSAGLSSIGLMGWAGLTAAESSLDEPASFEASQAEWKSALRRLENLGIRYLNVLPDEGRFLNMLVRASRAKRVLEIGSSYGYTSLWLAEALRATGGRLTSLEIDGERLNEARRHIRAAGLESWVTWHEGDAHELVPELAGPFDLVYIDADKDGLEDYFSKLYPRKLTSGAFLIAHEAIGMRESMQGYLRLLKEHPAFETAVVSVTLEDGFALSLRR